jgi:hypothetical protein
MARESILRCTLPEAEGSPTHVLAVQNFDQSLVFVSFVRH